jgi:hypothetical protein
VQICVPLIFAAFQPPGFPALSETLNPKPLDLILLYLLEEIWYTYQLRAIPENRNKRYCKKDHNGLNTETFKFRMGLIFKGGPMKSMPGYRRLSG